MSALVNRAGVTLGMRAAGAVDYFPWRPTGWGPDSFLNKSIAVTSHPSEPDHLGEPPPGGSVQPTAAEELLTLPAAARALLVSRAVLAALVVRGRLGQPVLNGDGQPCLRKATVLEYRARRRERREQGMRRVIELSRSMGLDEE